MGILDGYFLVEEKEATLLATILANLDPKDPDQQVIADAILCDLIEMGLVHMDKGPSTFGAWMRGADFDTMEKGYLDDDDD